MNYLSFFACTFLLSFAQLGAQTEAPDSAQVKMFAGMMHWSASALYAEDDATYSVNENWTAPWATKTLTQDVAQRSGRQVLDNAVASYKLDFFKKRNMIITSAFPASVDAAPGTASLKVTGSNLTDSLGTKVEAGGMNLNYSSERGEGAEAVKPFTATTYLRPKPVGGVSGTLTISVSSLMHYEKQEVSAKDEGKKMNIGDLEVTIRQFGEDRIVLEHNDRSSGLKMVQFNAAGEPLRRKKKGFGGGNANLPDFIYTAMEANPEMTKEEMQTLVFENADQLKAKDGAKVMTVFRTYEGVAKVTIYRAVLSEPVEKTITVE